MVYIFADSNNRTPSDPSNAYRLDLVSPIHNVSKVELVAAKIPNSMYNVTVGTISVNGIQSTIEPGFYTPCGLASAVPITTDYNENTGKFTFSSVQSFTIEAVSSDLQKCLGLSAGVKSSSATYTVTSDNVADLVVNDFVFLDIEEFRTTGMVDCKVFQGSKFSGSTINSVFAAIPLDVDPGSIKFFKETSDYRISASFASPIGTVSRLTIRWVDRNGNLLNFNGLDDNSFVLRCHTVREPVAPRLEMPAPVPAPPEPPKKKGGPRWFLIGGGVAVIAVLLWLFLRAQTTQVAPQLTGYSRGLLRPM